MWAFRALLVFLLFNTLFLYRNTVGAFSKEQEQNTGEPILWNSINCPKGNVVDAICVTNNNCKAFSTEQECHEDIGCLWLQGDKKCILNRDENNNVCTEQEINPICSNITAGVCPQIFVVESECCTPEAMKYNNILRVIDENMKNPVCCNAPCNNSQLLGCPLPDSCQPQGRSFGRHHDPAYFGFNTIYLDNVLRGHQFGQIIDGYASLGQMVSLPTSVKVATDSSQDKHVEEITADDVINSLIEALQNDKDVYGYNSEIQSHPIFQKQKFGGHLYGYKFPDPQIWLDQLYGGLIYRPLNFYSGLNFGTYGYDYQNNIYGNKNFPGYGVGYDDNKKGVNTYNINYGMYGDGPVGYGFSGHGPDGYDFNDYGFGGYGSDIYGFGGYGTGDYSSGGYGPDGYKSGGYDSNVHDFDGYGFGSYGYKGYGPNVYGSGSYGSDGYGCGVHDNIYGYGSGGYDKYNKFNNRRNNKNVQLYDDHYALSDYRNYNSGYTSDKRYGGNSDHYAGQRDYDQRHNYKDYEQYSYRNGNNEEPKSEYNSEYFTESNNFFNRYVYDQKDHY